MNSQSKVLLRARLILCERRWLSYTGRGQPCLAIRRETINAWERRAPLAPSHVKKLVKSGVKVLIQPSNRRAYPIQDYITAGAIVQEDIQQAQLIISVKQVPVEALLPNKTYAFFSHTIKAQPDNMGMLDTILHRKIRLIDFEKFTTAEGKRLVMFGKWAGYAGFIDILHGLGLRLLALGHHTPFIHIALAHNYSDSHMAINAVRDCGYEIALNRLPRSIGPLIFVFTGSGNVSQGAQDLFKHLPHEFIDASTLPQVAKKGQLNKVYGCVVSRSDHMIRKEGGPFDIHEFDEYPERYVSTFASEIAPYASVIINGVYWGVNTPRLLTIPDAKYLLTPTVNKSLEVPGCPSLPHRLMAICDISADPGGSIEFVTECTSIDKPFTIYDADFNTYSDSFNTPSGCLVCSIDNMPAQMPVEATDSFGNLLYPYIVDMLNCTTDNSFERIACRDEVKRAIITWDGELTHNYKYIEDLRKETKNRSHHKAKVMAGDAQKVLLLGAGMVSDPLAHYYSGQQRILLTVATDSSSDGQRLASLGNNISSVVVDVHKEPEVIEKLIAEHDLCISLLPYPFHPAIVKMCIKNKTNMVTSSYITPELQALDEDAKAAGITVMNESGLDPGIDHMLAMECIDMIHEYGGKVRSFVSFAGGLPSPEASDNALRYKFSWSPKGVLLALTNPARYLMNGQVVNIEGGGGVLDDIYQIDFMPGFSLIGYANRDSSVYAKIYGVENECQTLLRGTLRYKGFVEAIKALKAVGYLSVIKNDFLNPLQGPDLTWNQVMAHLMNQPTDIFPDSLKQIVVERLGGKEKIKEMQALEKLGLFAETPVERQYTPLDTLVPHLAKALAYEPGEKDIIILNHDIEATLPAGSLERHRISMVAYGDPDGYSAMARTVGYTAGIVSHMVLNGEIQRKGMLRPISREVYRPVLKRLQDFGIKATTKVTQFKIICEPNSMFDNVVHVDTNSELQIKRGRGRPRKSLPVKSHLHAELNSEPQLKRGRGRPRKSLPANYSENDEHLQNLTPKTVDSASSNENMDVVEKENTNSGLANPHVNVSENTPNTAKNCVPLRMTNNLIQFSLHASVLRKNWLVKSNHQ
ncbi:saccharopine dehydrogenase NADP binding domain-containing protein [Ditylenchus destructor]|uniref:Saccharopine dehydrogenase NADP binding domain-containing protein n=1 Tax=Ditylenchus destructor TaxID=166010 RepID=A0AAD4N2H3_9BILA|nr:saccharopine dehydrogenase NADP binding domain-containing protein [Ditylenchus destructor]